MSRRRVADKRKILPDPVHGSVLLAKFINCVMSHGEKAIAERIVYDAINKVVELYNKGKKDKPEDETSGSKDKGAKKVVKSSGPSAAEAKSGLELFSEALENVKPTVEVRARRVGGATYQVPAEIRKSRQMALAMRWLTDAAKERAGRGMAERLAREILDALEHKGNAVKKRETTHAMAKANQAFAHFRW